jgi:hypothetical protein
MSGTLLGLLAFGFSIGTGALWFRRIQAVAIPANRAAFATAMLAGLALGVAALSQSPGYVGGTAAVIAIALGSLFTLTVLIGGQKGGAGVLEVGKLLPQFTAPDENDQPFEIASLAGKPLLLKFFRGHW